MGITCDKCGAKYKLPSGLAGLSTYKTTCRQCGNRISVSLNADMTEIRTRTIHPKKSGEVNHIDADISIGPAVDASDALASNHNSPHESDDHTIEIGARPEVTIDEGISTMATPALIHDFDDLLPDDPTQEDDIIPPPPIISFAPDEDPALSATSTQRVRAAINDSEYSQLILVSALLSIAALFGMVALVPGDLGYVVASGIATAGLTLIIFVTLTSGYGRQSAKMLLSYSAALVFGALFSFGVYYRDVIDSKDGNTRVETLAQSSDEESETPAPSSEANQEQAPGDNKEVLADNSAPVAKKPKRQRTRSSKTGSSRSNSRNSKSPPTSAKASSFPATEAGDGEASEDDDQLNADSTDGEVSDSEDRPFDDMEGEATGVSALTGLPDSMIKDILLKNKDITKCFLNERSNNGKVPSAAPLRFVVNPQGYVVDMKVYKGQFVGSSFERCLRNAIRKISFPPFEGKDQVIQYVLRPG